MSIDNCVFTATATTANVNVSELESCLDTTQSTASVVDQMSGGGAIDVNAPISVPGCSNSGLELRNSVGGVNVSNPVNLGSGACELDLWADQADITQTASSPITASRLLTNLSNGGNLTLTAAGNAFGYIEPSGVTTGSLSIVDSTLLSPDSIYGASGGVSISDPAGIQMSGLIDTTGAVTLASSAGTISGTTGNSGSVTGSSLNVSAANGIDLEGGNYVTQLTASSSNGSVILSGGSSALNVKSVSAEGNAIIYADGDLTVSGPVTAGPSGQVQLTSYDGSVDETGLGAITAGSLNAEGAYGDADLNGANAVASVSIGAGRGDATFFDDTTSPLVLTASGASGAVHINQVGGPIKIAGAVKASSIYLDATSLTSQSGGSLQSPTIALFDPTGDGPWTVTPTAVTDDGDAAIAYSGTSSLTISAANNFNVTPSSSTAYTFNATSGDDTLTYFANGASVSGSPGPSSGEIDASDLEPVDYSGMSAVNVLGAAAPSTGSGSGSGPGESGSGVGGSGSGGVSSGGSPSGGSSSTGASQTQTSTRAVAYGTARLLSVHTTRGVVSAAVKCTSARSTCQVSLNLAAGLRTRSAASETIAIKGGKTVTIKLKLVSAAARALKKDRELEGRLTVTERTAEGSKSLGSRNVTLRSR